MTMAILSVLRKSNLWKTFIGFQKVPCQTTFKGNNALQVPIRNMASDHGHKIFHITPSRFNYSQFKDDLHFYTMLGVVPLGLLIFFVNIYVGPAELAEIPEGYEPKQWEYYKNPIKRFFARYIQPSEQQEYEKYLHTINEEMERMQWRMNTEKAKMLMAERNDYQGPLYIPSYYGRQIRQARYEADAMDARKGF